MNTALQTIASAPDATAIEAALIDGDLAKLTPAQRVGLYRSTCESLGLNQLTKPFEYIKLNGKLVLYPKKDATDQLRMIHGVSITRLTPQSVDDLYIVTAEATNAEGRTDSATGAVCVTGLKGEAKANAIMKAETKAKRRVTLSICGLGMTDESEVGSIDNARPVQVNTETGEIVGEAKADPPEGFEAWADDVSAAVTESHEKFAEAWKTAKGEFRAFVREHRPELLDEWKRASEGATRAA